jgi:hypothetical protein
MNWDDVPPPPDPSTRVDLPPPPGYPRVSGDDILACLLGFLLGGLLVWSFVIGWWT